VTRSDHLCNSKLENVAFIKIHTVIKRKKLRGSRDDWHKY